MLNIEAPYYYCAGLRAIAEKQGISIPEAALLAMEDIIDHNYIDMVPDVVMAAQSLNPGDIYTRGLWQIAGVTPSLKEAVTRVIADLQSKLADEHIEPTKHAFTWHTGEEY